MGKNFWLLDGTEVGEEVHLEGVSQLCRGAEGEVNVLGKDFRNIGTGNMHALG